MEPTTNLAYIFEFETLRQRHKRQICFDLEGEEVVEVRRIHGGAVNGIASALKMRRRIVIW